MLQHIVVYLSEVVTPAILEITQHQIKNIWPKYIFCRKMEDEIVLLFMCDFWIEIEVFKVLVKVRIGRIVSLKHPPDQYNTSMQFLRFDFGIARVYKKWSIVRRGVTHIRISKAVTNNSVNATNHILYTKSNMVLIFLIAFTIVNNNCSYKKQIAQPNP